MESKKAIKEKIALRREYNSKKFYWEGKERIAEQYIKKYSSIVERLEKEIKHLERNKENVE